MSSPGPQLDRLLHRLAECPPDFLSGPNEIDVTALICDHYRAVGVAIPGPLERRSLTRLSDETRHLIPVILWLLRDDWFLARPQLVHATWSLLQSEALTRLAKLVRVDSVVYDPDRREETVRLCLKELNLVPEGESIAQAVDRLTMLDSAERERVIRDTRQAEARTREIREAMARRRAEEAAARYSPE